MFTDLFRDRKPERPHFFVLICIVLPQGFIFHTSLIRHHSAGNALGDFHVPLAELFLWLVHLGLTPREPSPALPPRNDMVLSFHCPGGFFETGIRGLLYRMYSEYTGK